MRDAQLHHLPIGPYNLGERAKGRCDSIAEGLWAVQVDWVWPERCAQDCAASSQRAARPPNVQSGDMTVSNGFLTARMGRDGPDRQVNLNQPLRIRGPHDVAFPVGASSAFTTLDAISKSRSNRRSRKLR